MIRFVSRALCLIVSFSLICGSASFAQEKEELDPYDQIMQILGSAQILSLEKQLELSLYVSKLQADDYSLEKLEELMLHFDRKVDRDKSALRDILVNTEKMMDVKYAKYIDRVGQGQIKDMWSYYRRLDDRVRDVRSKARFQRVMSKNNDFYKDMITKYSYFITDEKEAYNLVDFWSLLQKNIGEPYHKWAEKKDFLDKRQEKYTGEFAGYNKNLSFEESSFIKIFSTIQVLVRRVSESENEFMGLDP